MLVPGDIVKLTKGYASLFRGCLTIYSGKSGEILKMGDFCMVFNEQINMSEPQQNSQPPAAVNNIAANANSTSSNGGNNNGSRPAVAPPVTPVTSTNPAVTSTSTPANPTGKQTKNTTPPSKNYIRKPINKK